MPIFTRPSLATCLVLLAPFALRLSADSVTYEVTVNTSSQVGNSGYIDLQLNPGSLTPVPAVNAGIDGFTTDGVLNPADANNGTVGTVSGALPGGLSFANDLSTNEYTEALTFGNSITFAISLSGPGIDSSGHAGGASGTIFVLDFLDPNGNYLFTNDPSGNPPSSASGVIDISASGLVTATANPGENGPSDVSFSAIPEPAPYACLLIAFVFLAARRYLSTN